MRIGIAGVGRMGAFHAGTLGRRPGIDSVVVADAERARVRDVAGRLRLDSAESPEALLRSGIDALVIATATSAHAEFIVRATAAGLPVFCEKPFAPDIEGTLAVIKRLGEAAGAVQIGFQRRFDAGYRTTREAVRSGALGWVQTLRATTLDPAPPPRAYLAGSGGLYRDCGVHDFDAIRWAFPPGRPTRCSSTGSPAPTSVGLEEVETFGKFLGGSATNVAAARHGRSAAVITRTGADPFGRYVHAELIRLGVDDAFVTAVPGLPTPVTFCEIFPPDLSRSGSTVTQRHLTSKYVLTNCLSKPSSRRGCCGSPGPGCPPSRAVAPTGPPWTSGATGRRPYSTSTTDHRSGRPGKQPGCSCAPSCPGSRWRSGTSTSARPRSAPGIRTGPRPGLLAAGVQLAVVKQGPAGVLARTADELVAVAPIPVQVVNGIGAGDGFGGALCHGLLAGWPLEQTLRFANAAGAIVTTRLECSIAMPITAEASCGRAELAGRTSVFEALTDCAYVPRDSALRVATAAGGRFALASARARRRMEFRHVRVEQVEVELRGAGSWPPSGTRRSRSPTPPGTPRCPGRRRCWAWSTR